MLASCFGFISRKAILPGEQAFFHGNIKKARSVNMTGLPVVVSITDYMR